MKKHQLAMNKSLYKLIRRAYAYNDARGFPEDLVIEAIDNGWITVDAIGQLFHTSKGVKACKEWIVAGKPEK